MSEHVSVYQGSFLAKGLDAVGFRLSKDIEDLSTEAPHMSSSVDGVTRSTDASDTRIRETGDNPAQDEQRETKRNYTKQATYM